MAASLVSHTLKDSRVFEFWPHFEGKCSVGWKSRYLYRGNSVFKKNKKNPHASYNQRDSDLLYKNAIKRCKLSSVGADKSCMIWFTMATDSQNEQPQEAWRKHCRSCKKRAKKPMNIKTKRIKGNKKVLRSFLTITACEV